MSGDDVGVSLCLGQANAGFQSTDRAQKVRLALLHPRSRVEVERHPKLRRLWQAQALRHHADDLICFAVERDRLVDDLRIAREMFLPESVTEDSDLIVAGLFIFE